VAFGWTRLRGKMKLSVSGKTWLAPIFIVIVVVLMLWSAHNGHNPPAHAPPGRGGRGRLRPPAAARHLEPDRLALRGGPGPPPGRQLLHPGEAPSALARLRARAH